MSGPYSTEFVYLDDNDQAPYIFEEDFNQNIAPYACSQSQQQPYAPHNFFPPQSLPAYPQALSSSVYDTELPPAKRLRSHNLRPFAAPARPSTPPRSTTPEIEPPYHARIFSPRALPGSFTSILSTSLSIPDSVTAEERLRRQSEIDHIFTATKSTVLPPPSPYAKRFPTSPVPSFTQIYKIRAPPQPVKVAPILPKRSLGAFIRIDDVPVGPEREVAAAHNNRLAGERLEELKRRNNAAASRSRNRRERAVVGRTEELSGARGQMNWWKARAVSLGARTSEWDELPEKAARDVIVADYRVDAMDFSRDAPREEGAGEKTENKAMIKKKKKPAKKQ